MAWFIIDELINNKNYVLTGENAHHVIKSLRMKTNETITICTKDNKEHLCKITGFENNNVCLEVLSSKECLQEPSVNVTLFMSLVKSDKMDMIIQKSVELGIKEITPIITSRCISRPDKKGMDSKIKRWQKISENAASQSRRGLIPKINSLVKLEDIDLSTFDTSIVFYENGGEQIKDIIKDTSKKIAIIIGSEGGFSEDEINKIKNKGAKVATLGKRILRAETAPLVSLSAIMYETNNI